MRKRERSAPAPSSPRAAGLRLPVRLVGMAALLLSGCVQFSEYGRPCTAELEPLVAGWRPDLTVRNGSREDSALQYRWEAPSGVSVEIGTLGVSGEVPIVELTVRNGGRRMAILGMDEPGDPGLHLWTTGGDAAFRILRQGDSLAVPVGGRRRVEVRGFPWTRETKVGDRFAFDLKIAVEGRVETCPCAFAVNHLREH